MNQTNATQSKKQQNWPKDLKRTRQRESVLALLEQAEEPLSAAEICARLEAGGEATSLSTVYRVLDLFVERQLALKTNPQNGDTAVFERNRHLHNHYAVCVNCHKMVRMQNCPLERFVPEISEQDFCVTGHHLEVFGLCGDCKLK